MKSLGRRRLLLSGSLGAISVLGTLGYVLSTPAYAQTAGSSSTPPAPVPVPVLSAPYAPRGVGGGGAFVGYSISPFQQLRFVGTDMGTLFRSTDDGASWQAIPNASVLFFSELNGQDYTDLPGPGYSATPNVVFHAPAKGSPVVSTDGGILWEAMTLGSDSNRVRSWYPDTYTAGRVFAGLDDGFAMTQNDGESWTQFGQGMGQAKGLFLDSQGTVLYVAFDDGIYISQDGGSTLTQIISETSGLHRFAGGRGTSGLVFSYVTEPNGPTTGTVYTGTPQGMMPAALSSQGSLSTLMNCEHVRMADNDSAIYAAGARGCGNQYGTTIFKGNGATGAFTAVFNSADHGRGQDPWPTLRPSAVGLDIGYYDDGYFTFAVNQLNSRSVGGGELYFLHVSEDGGQNWISPFTSSVSATPGPGQAWSSTGLEVCSIRWVKFSAAAPAFGIACGCDYSILATEDGGLTWRICTNQNQWGATLAPHQSVYDVIFDPVDPNTAICAFSDLHDFQHSGNFGHCGSGVGGGVYVTRDRGRSWTQLGNGIQGSSGPFLSLAQDPATGTIYAGSQGNGVAVMDSAGNNWSWQNTGFLDPNPIIGQLEVDSASGNLYALAGSDPSMASSTWQWSGLYVMTPGSGTWTQLRGNPSPPYWNAPANTYMLYPTSFALIRNEVGAVTGFFVTDAERCGNYLETGLWTSTDNGQTWNRVVQYTFATNVKIDPTNPELIYLSGDTSAGWGQGGAMYSTDGGQTFRQNAALQISYSVWSVTPDPSDSESVFYNCFGGGMRHGPKPS